MVAFLVLFSSVSAQQWAGTDINALTYRNGDAILGGSYLIGSFGGERILQLQGNSGAIMSMRTTSPVNGFDTYLGTSWLNMNLVSGTMFFSTDYSARMMILNNGNIGIGTTESGMLSNPNGYKLAVNGKIGAKEVQVENTSSTWADYVFDPNYKLMPLRDVENFVKVNKHLPEIPSADEVKTHGHKLGEMDVLLLKKVEELTLHVIELKKEIEELKKKTTSQNIK